MASKTRKTFKVFELSGERTFTLCGKEAQILTELIDRGPEGLTALDLRVWTTRLANYITEYRNRQGLSIETKTEKNTGQFGGSHGRYILRSLVDAVTEPHNEGRSDGLQH